MYKSIALHRKTIKNWGYIIRMVFSSKKASTQYFQGWFFFCFFFFGGGGGGGGAIRAKAAPPLKIKSCACVRLTVRLSSKQGDEETSSSCSACSAPKRQCQGVEVSSSNLRQYFMGAK